jgi:hypothetical protein
MLRDMTVDRFSAQLLSGARAPDVAAAVGRILAVQSQDLPAARLAIRVRTLGTLASDVDHALSSDRSLVVTWLNRGTLHLVRAEDYWWLHGLTAPLAATANERRLAEQGLPPSVAARGVRLITRSLARDGPLSRRQLRELLQSGGVPTEGQGLLQLLFRASQQGHIVRGPIVGSEQAYVLRRDWLPEPPRFERERALSELARRYLAGHGPADDRDLAKWSGLPLRETRVALRSIASELVEDETGLVVLAKQPAPAGIPPPRLLGPFDPVLFGWRSRTHVLGTHSSIVTTNGIFRTIVLIEGRAVGSWKLTGRMLILRIFEPDALSRGRAEITHDAHDLLRFLAIRGPLEIVAAEG